MPIVLLIFTIRAENHEWLLTVNSVNWLYYKKTTKIRVPLKFWLAKFHEASSLFIVGWRIAENRKTDQNHCKVKQ